MHIVGTFSEKKINEDNSDRIIALKHKELSTFTKL